MKALASHQLAGLRTGAFLVERDPLTVNRLLLSLHLPIGQF